METIGQRLMLLAAVVVFIDLTALALLVAAL